MVFRTTTATGIPTTSSSSSPKADASATATRTMLTDTRSSGALRSAEFSVPGGRRIDERHDAIVGRARASGFDVAVVPKLDKRCYEPCGCCLHPRRCLNRPSDQADRSEVRRNLESVAEVAHRLTSSRLRAKEATDDFVAKIPGVVEIVQQRFRGEESEVGQRCQVVGEAKFRPGVDECQQLSPIGRVRRLPEGRRRGTSHLRRVLDG